MISKNRIFNALALSDDTSEYTECSNGNEHTASNNKYLNVIHMDMDMDMNNNRNINDGDESNCNEKSKCDYESIINEIKTHHNDIIMGIDANDPDPNDLVEKLIYKKTKDLDESGQNNQDLTKLISRLSRLIIDDELKKNDIARKIVDKKYKRKQLSEQHFTNETSIVYDKYNEEISGKIITTLIRNGKKYYKDNSYKDPVHEYSQDKYFDEYKCKPSNDFCFDFL
jgi:hypothetical protein